MVRKRNFSEKIKKNPLQCCFKLQREVLRFKEVWKATAASARVAPTKDNIPGTQLYLAIIDPDTIY